ncbi:MAG: 23S rRNA (uracil(1939)-C(5))-methyltransferase RlmD [Bacteroidetes bacterium]|nr:23S rRNA (uracil(1939)-C(5))-methyltransferase RlmD [Bacteroidota bacterium]
MVENTPYQRGDEVILEIETAAFEGKSIARLGSFVVFVEGAVPGDRVRARLTKIKRNYGEAQVTEILTPSKDRTEPRCPYFGGCGGCRWQHVTYETQLRYKQQHVLDAFERIAGFRAVPLQPIIGSQEQYAYRNKMEFSFASEQWKWKGMKETLVPVYLGLHVPQRYDKVLDIETCYLQSERLNRLLSATRDFARSHQLTVYNSKSHTGFLRFLVLRETKNTNQVLINLVTSDVNDAIVSTYVAHIRSVEPTVTTIVNTVNRRKAQIATGDEVRVAYGEGFIEERIGDFRFAISAESFFQTNSLQAEKLYSVVKRLGQFSPNDVVYDLYCGTGSISIYVSNCVANVIGIEVVESAIRDAWKNAELNGSKNCVFVQGDLKERLTTSNGWMEQYPKPTVIILDPPRTGMHPKVVDRVLEIAPDRIIYVSCNPTTQARDVKLLSREYELLVVQPVDMFPHTYHVESVAYLVRKHHSAV